LLREADRGRFAAAPASIPAKGWRDVFWRVAYNVIDDRVLPLAGGVAYYALLAVFPAVAMTVSLYGLFADTSTVSRHLVLLSDILPPGSADLLAQQMTRIAGQSANTLGIAFLTSLLISLWSANAGMSALFDALNVVYKEKEKRPLWRFYVTTLLFTVVAVVFLAVAIAAIVVVRWCSTSSAGAVTAVPVGLLRWPGLFRDRGRRRSSTASRAADRLSLDHLGQRHRRKRLDPASMLFSGVGNFDSYNR
jgi:membrane protein